MLSRYGFKRVADPVHGTVGLSQLEVELLSTQAFQRLRNIKQLGMAHLVFPGADYSRLAHCIGVCHVTGRILDSLIMFGGVEVDEAEHQLYRVAGLLHDIGHFPFSHAFEDAVSDYYQKEIVTPSILTSDSASDQDTDQQPFGDDHPPDHEDVGQLLLESDGEISSILDRYNISPRDVSSVFTRKQPPRKFANLISSDLDADRIDYLLRTAHHTGLPYGSVDVEYILSQLRLDKEDRICLTSKALRTAEHFLLGRYFDYQQVTYHKTVAAFELVLKDIVRRLLESEELDCSMSGIGKMIESGWWYQFDDPGILSMIRELEEKYDTSDKVLKAKIGSLLRRTPPTLIGSTEFISDRNKTGEHSLSVRELQRISSELSDEFHIECGLWYVWDSEGIPLTSVGSHTPISMVPADEDELVQSIRIRVGDGSEPIVSIPSSLMSVLAQQALYTARLYVILPEGRECERGNITEAARSKISHDHWIDGK